MAKLRLSEQVQSYSQYKIVGSVRKIEVVGYFWTYDTEEMQKAFFRDWGRYWNCETEETDEA